MNFSNKILNRILIFYLVLMLIFFPIRILVQYYNNNFIISILSYFNIKIDYFVAYHHALCGVVLFLLFKKIFSKISENKILDFSDKYSYYIYLVHQIFILNEFSLLYITSNLGVNIVLIVVSIIISSIILFKFVSIINNFNSKIMYMMHKLKLM
jgi:hypothetical protein